MQAHGRCINRAPVRESPRRWHRQSEPGARWSPATHGTLLYDIRFGRPACRAAPTAPAGGNRRYQDNRQDTDHDQKDLCNIQTVSSLLFITPGSMTPTGCRPIHHSIPASRACVRICTFCMAGCSGRRTMPGTAMSGTAVRTQRSALQSSMFKIPSS